jgi:AcrR family transcriptional regulator
MSAVAQSERRRLLVAMLEELVEKGYPGTEVAAAARRADLEGTEWSAWFADKDACLFEAFEQLSQELRDAIRQGCAAGDDWTTRVAGGLRALLAALAARAPLAEALARSFPAIGPAAQARYQSFVESLAPLLTAGREPTIDDELPAEIELLAVGAGEALVFEEICAARAAGLPALAPEILFSVLVPFTGAAAAATAMEAERLASGRPSGAG